MCSRYICDHWLCWREFFSSNKEVINSWTRARACQSRYLRSRVNFWSVDRSMRSIKYYSIKFSTEWTVLNRCVFIYIYNSDYYAGLIIFRLSSRCWPNWLVWTFPATPTIVTRTWGHRLHYRPCRQIQRLGISWHVLWSWLVYTTISITGTELWDGGWGRGGVGTK